MQIFVGKLPDYVAFNNESMVKKANKRLTIKTERVETLNL